MKSKRVDFQTGVRTKSIHHFMQITNTSKSAMMLGEPNKQLCEDRPPGGHVHQVGVLGRKRNYKKE